MLPKKSKHVCVSRGPFYHFSQIPLFSFYLHLLNFPLTIILATNPMNNSWSHACQGKDGKSVRTAKQYSQVGYSSSAKVMYYFPMNHTVKSFHRRLRTGDLHHICVCYVITAAFPGYKMETFENKDKTVGWAVWFFFPSFPAFANSY